MEPHAMFYLAPWLGESSRPFTVITEICISGSGRFIALLVVSAVFGWRICSGRPPGNHAQPDILRMSIRADITSQTSSRFGT